MSSENQIKKTWKYNTDYPSTEDLIKKAKKQIPRFAFEYLSGGCNEDVNLIKNTAELRQVEFEALAQATTYNAVTLFNLPKSLVFPTADADTFRLPTPAGG